MLFGATTDDLNEEIGGVGVVGAVADLIERQEVRADIGADPAFDAAAGASLQLRLREGCQEDVGLQRFCVARSTRSLRSSAVCARPSRRKPGGA